MRKVLWSILAALAVYITTNALRPKSPALATRMVLRNRANDLMQELRELRFKLEQNRARDTAYLGRPSAETKLLEQRLADGFNELRELGPYLERWHWDQIRFLAIGLLPEPFEQTA
jgi:hypothetical protein